MKHIKLILIVFILGLFLNHLVSCDSENGTNSEVEIIIEESTVTDIDGNTYMTVKIGSQWWMTENLATTTFNDGTPITLVEGNTTWNNITTPAYCWYDNNEDANKYSKGALYNWYVVNTQKLCPSNWHVPSQKEWEKLEEYLDSLGYNRTQGKILKSETGWKDEGNGIDFFHFSAKPSGYLFSEESFKGVGESGNWWTSSLFFDFESPAKPWLVFMHYELDYVFHIYGDKKENGYSVRCIKD